MTQSVKNYFEQADADTDNKFIVNGTMDITGTWKIDGTAVTATAEQLNAIDSVEEVANKSGLPMIAGQLVYISGYDTTLDLPIVSLADADDATKKATLVLIDAIADNASGSAEPEATVTGLNTSAFSAVGSLVYESTTEGEFTQTAPIDADDDRRVVGVVKVKDASGAIYFFPGKGGLEHAAVYLNNLTPGTVKASGAVVVDAALHQDVVHTASLNLGATSATVAVTSNAGELNLLDTAVAGEVVASKAVIYDASGKIAVSSADVTATGTVIGDATAMTAQKNVISGANGAKGVILPIATVDAEVTVINSDTSNDLLVYPVAGSQINALGASVAFTVTAGQTGTFIARSTTLWNVASATDTITGLTATAAELNYNDLTGAIGTVEASKTVVVDASKDIADFRNLSSTNLLAGKDAVAGSVTIFPTTTVSGKTVYASTDNTGDTTTDVVMAAQSGARTYTTPDAGASAEYVMNIDTTDHVKFLGLNDIIGGPVDGPSVGTWAATRVAQGDYVNRKVAGDETAIIGLDITEALRTTASKGLKLTSFDVIFRNTVADLDAHSVVLDRIEYTDSAVVSVNTIALTGSLGVGQDNDPQIDNVVIDTPLFNITDDSKYVMELTIDAAAASVVDWIGVMLKFTSNMK